jgi:DNA-binding XRE family transcriptional regulator
MPHADLGSLTAAERLLVDRRRRDETQAEAALRYKVSQSRYSRWERGLDDPIETLGPGPVLPRVSPLKPHEKCLLYRRRVGVTQAKVAEDLNRCKMWVRQMERGEVDSTELVQYWEQ